MHIELYFYLALAWLLNLATAQTCSTSGDLRLVGGTNQYEGRVEVCFNNAWGTVCDNSWGESDARVVCKQLGYAYSGYGTPLLNAYFGEGTGSIVLDGVGCTGSESQLLACPSSSTISSSCGHDDDASVRCEAPCGNGDIRLAGGTVPNEGRVEICKDSAWGTVCHDYWDAVDAMVVCNQLGYPATDAVAYTNPQFGAGTGYQHLDNVACTGTEPRLISCSSSSTISCYGGHNSDAGVRCQVNSTGHSCTYGDVRLVGGSSQYEGRVEVCINDQWGTVCDNSWNTADATTICRQLNYAYTDTGKAYSNAYYGQGTGPIFIDSVQCSSSHTKLLQCPSSPILQVSSNCGHDDDAGIKCEAPCTDGQLRLVGGSIPSEGRVEICLDNVWGTICDDYWDDKDAAVVCQQLGYPPTDAVPFSNAHYGAGVGTQFLDSVACSGSETRLLYCSSSTNVYCSGGHNGDAGVRCQVESVGSNCTYGDIRLVGGSNQYEGRVEVCINDQWGTVCDNQWNYPDATTVCKQLGYAYTSTGQAYTNAYFGKGTGLIHLDNVQCASNDEKILHCPSSPILQVSSNCGHDDDAGVACEAPCSTNGQLRLVGGSIPNEGRVEICMDNEWGTVCDDGWGDSDAAVVCRQLGYSATDAVSFPNANFGPGIGVQFLDNVACTGSETTLIQCSSSSSVYCSYGHNEDAGVRCQIESVGSNCTYGDIRLVGGNNQYEGRVEVCINDQWGTVCDNSWNTADATSVCKQLGYAYTSTGQAYNNAFFGEGTGLILMDNVQCASNDAKLLHCPSSPIFQPSSTCGHEDDAGVACEAPCSTGQLRLVGASIPNEGRVEICMDNEWGTICDDGWGDSDASVVCRQLGYPATDAVAFLNAKYGPGIGTQFLDYVTCTGGETKLTQCSSSSSVYCSNGHNGDAGVRCQIVLVGSTCTYGDVRLVGGSNQYEGRVEVCINDQWGTVCDNGWTTEDATTVCEQLGYAYTGSGLAYFNAYFVQGTGLIHLDNVQCGSHDEKILHCSSNPILQVSSNCGHDDDAGVGCEAPCTSGQLRLVGGNVPNEGRVEMCMDNIWGTICDDGWGTSDATVVCRQLGYPPMDAVAFSNAYFGAGVGSQFLDNVACTGTETMLTRCSSSSSVYCSQGHNEDAGVKCQVAIMGSICNYGDIRLVNGSNPYEGRVEVCINDQWGTVCDNLWDDTDATVVCKQLGYAYTLVGEAVNGGTFGRGCGPVAVSKVQCTSANTKLLQCYSSPLFPGSCSTVNGAGVRCEAPCQDGELRLVGGQSANEGGVEICIDNVWGFVCDSNWDINDASVVCTILGYLPTGAQAYSNSYFGTGAGAPFLNSVGCTGSEARLLDCSHTTTSCSQSDEAGVFCQVPIVSSSSEPPGSSLVKPSHLLTSTLLMEVSFPSLSLHLPVSSLLVASSSRPELLISSAPTLLSLSSIICVLPSQPYLESLSKLVPRISSSNVPPPPSQPTALSSKQAAFTPMNTHTIPASASLTSSASIPINTPIIFSPASIAFSETYLKVSTEPNIQTLSLRKEVNPSNTATSSKMIPMASTCLPISNGQVGLENSITVSFTGYTVQQFTNEVEKSFKDVTLRVVDAYCLAYARSCIIISMGGEVLDSDEKCVVIMSIGGMSRSRQANGPLQLEMYVSANGGTAVLSQATLSNAVKAGISNGDYEAAGFFEASIITSTSAEPSSDSAASSSTSTIEVVIGITLVVLFVLMVALVGFVLIITFKSRKFKKRYNLRRESTNENLEINVAYQRSKEGDNEEKKSITNETEGNTYVM